MKFMLKSHWCLNQMYILPLSLSDTHTQIRISWILKSHDWFPYVKILVHLSLITVFSFLVLLIKRISQVRYLLQILRFLSLKGAQSIHFARHLLLLTQAPMGDSLFLGGMQMNACHHLWAFFNPVSSWLTSVIFIAPSFVFLLHIVKFLLFD